MSILFQKGFFYQYCTGCSDKIWQIVSSLFGCDSSRFFKIADGPEAGWYAGVPIHALEENDMVAGRDTFLEEVDQMADNDCVVNIT